MDKFDSVKMEAAIETFMENVFWREVYENAPSDNCREYFRQGFYSSIYPEPNDADERRREVFDRFGIKDWQYLKKIYTGTPFVKTCHDRIQALLAKEQKNLQQTGESEESGDG